MSGPRALPAPGEAVVVTVFAAAPGGGNPAPIVLDAGAMDDRAMQRVAADTGHESGFVVGVPDGVTADVALRFWVPNHEMSMCGHATIAAVWLLHEYGVLRGDAAVVHTASGPVEARFDRPDRVSISQPAGRITAVDAAGVAAVESALGTAADRRAPTVNAATSRVKTLLPVADVGVLDALAPDPDAVTAACDRIGSTGLYPFAPVDPARQVYAARQFPKASGYAEDPATGIAAAALAFGLLDAGQVDPRRTVLVRQGSAMGRPSEISVDFRLDDDGTVTGCWVGGSAHRATAPYPGGAGSRR